MSELRDDPIGGLLAAPMADTLKRADGESGSGDPARVLRTEDRRALWHAQTPRVFRFAGLARALEVTAASTAIDELEALEMLAASGDIAQPRLIAGSPLNVRVRDRAGATLALAILRAQDQGDTQTAAA
jgi:2-C-methyl-D-erythritol 4-phosphate cytidylyltransferase